MIRNHRDIQVARARLLSEVWVCSNCGAKVYRGKLTAPPPERCPCGKESWQRQRDTCFKI